MTVRRRGFTFPLFLFASSLAAFGILGCGRFDAQPEPPKDASRAGSGDKSNTESLSGTGTKSDIAAPSASNVAFVPKRVTGGGQAMGTIVDLAAFTTPSLSEDAITQALREAFEEIRRVEHVMTTWDKDAVLSRVNESAGKAPVVVDDETLSVIEEARKMNERSSGTFDITFESMHGLWKFDQDLDPHPPDEAKIKDILPFVGNKHIVIDREKKTVFLDKARTKISLGGIAKGYGVDRAKKVLDDKGIASFYIKAGGDLFARGHKPDGSEWSAGIRDPRGPSESFFAILPLSDHAFSTAGDYERSYLKDGKRYHHILDPRTGHPATACRSVTIWAESALIADAIDDAVFILGPEKGLALVEDTPGVGAVIVDAKNKVWISKRLEGKLRVTREPTDGI